MLKNQEKIFQNFKGPRENRQKYRKTCEKRENRQKYRKTFEKYSKISKNRKNVGNPLKISLNLVNPIKNIEKSSKM